MMKKFSCALLGAVLTVCSGAAIADNHEQEEELRFVPVEVYTCNYRAGKGPGDLAKVIDKWNAYMDGNKANDYAAYTMSPVHFSEWAFDVAWVGVWRDGNAMGTGIQSYMETGAEIGDEFNKVLKCPTHGVFSSLRMRAGDANDNDGQFVAAFSNCSIREGKNMSDATAAMKEWNAARDEAGVVEGESWWFPGPGNDDLDADFKVVSVISDWKTAGANYEIVANGGVWRKSQAVQNALDCDSGRTYNVKQHRKMAEKS